MNPFNFRWYEFDDQYATEVDVATVQSAEAYVLFYRKCSDKIDRLRQEVAKNLDTNQVYNFFLKFVSKILLKFIACSFLQTSLMKFYISREWIHRFNTFAEPGSITNFDFLCPHGCNFGQIFYFNLNLYVIRFCRDISVESRISV